MDKMGDPNAHDTIRLKAAQLAGELSNAIYQTSSEGVLKVKNQAQSDWDKRSNSLPLQSYLIMKGINPENLAQLKKAQRQFDKEEEGENKTKGHNLLADDAS
jgi:predicted transcriptional regulator